MLWFDVNTMVDVARKLFINEAVLGDFKLLITCLGSGGLVGVVTGI